MDPTSENKDSRTCLKSSLQPSLSYKPLSLCIQMSKMNDDSVYRITSKLDELRNTEYSYLDEQNQIYLDYTGAGLAADAQYFAHRKRLAATLYGNPHSVNPTSQAATDLIEETRASVLAHLNASPREYAVVFTQNATSAARLVGEAYSWKKRKRLILSTDNHNSIHGLREFARRGGAKTVYVRTEGPELRINQDTLLSALKSRSGLDALFSSKSDSQYRGLFAYPAQSNFSGVRHPLSWVALAQEHGYEVLLDTAAYLPTSVLDLSVIQPEFLIISWYKLFGYPTGVGCLVARRSALARLSRPWFSGGTIKAVSVATPWFGMATDETAFEDGTLNFLSIPEIIFGLNWLKRIGMDIILTRVLWLTKLFLDRLQSLKHSDGKPMVRIYGPKDIRGRGATVAFNFLDAGGKIVDERLVAKESAAANISLRTGCFCNPGVAEDAMGRSARTKTPIQEMKTASVEELIDIVGLPASGAIRVSFGLVSNIADLDQFFIFALTYQNRVTDNHGLPPRGGC
ncbi:pyridoxal phosphate-dependent transferase [Bisporella sp. PMI_857]|nr:pyridoxal phosphate-dependent transferase [Bisporella sp. PMI_857]